MHVFAQCTYFNAFSAKDICLSGINYIFLNNYFVGIPLDLRGEELFKKYNLFIYCRPLGRFNNPTFRFKTKTCHL